MPVSIPSWTPAGLLPPINPSSPTDNRDRSPYRATLADFVARFAISAERVQIAKGLLDFRAALHALGIRQGQQWLDGSYLENVELIQGRAPRDVDVVTFLLLDPTFRLPAGDHDALDHTRSKMSYLVDNQFIELTSLPPIEIVRWTAYWYGLWSHRRDASWKGFIEVDLAPLDDNAARLVLDQWTPPIRTGALS